MISNYGNYGPSGRGVGATSNRGPDSTAYTQEVMPCKTDDGQVGRRAHGGADCVPLNVKASTGKTHATAPTLKNAGQAPQEESQWGFLKRHWPILAGGAAALIVAGVVLSRK